MRDIVVDVYWWCATGSIGVLFNIFEWVIIFNVDGVVAFEANFLKAYECWAIFCNHHHHHHHRLLRLARISLTSPYYSSPLAGLQGYIPYHHIAAVCMLELVVLLLIRVIDYCSFDIPLDYFIIHVILVLRFWGIFILSFACLRSFIFDLHFFEFFKLLWCGYCGGLCLFNSFNWFLFFNSNIFRFIFIYVFVNIRRSDG